MPAPARKRKRPAAATPAAAASSKGRAMLARELPLNPTDPATWLILGVGITVGASVGGLVALLGRWLRRRRPAGSKEEDLSWQNLLESLRLRRKEREEAGLAADEDLPPEELFMELLATLPAEVPGEPWSAVEDMKSQSWGGIRGGPAAEPEDLQFQAQGGVERRAGQYRWGNPTEVHVYAYLWPGHAHGLVINRSTGGLAILIQEEVPTGTSIKVRPIEAPRSVPFVKLEVRHCRKAGQLFLVGCQFCEEVPWNVRVWFG
jgi:hypothetical protein